ncbi:MAG: hypothetical protein A2015_16005 [Spirochaetes bacterium GWF1_31_7]|nr:MAG: hypothetical protein A2Y30_13380 [Spirochaetes bacterium GWE1_32_154]OHD49958.1 MAG: hypothetical protein A2Y29_11425 [Spirochaetes bacterium GWE2_31_10]OHD52275.1 MAG: hypothetical protein A2015_16005 [Spirochaetes bacterium GWF1_31_7]OHD72986.1 MAG: hypothetical protein A2355_07070 [Spirochaetes bacterium RIFOXYB1_FULL_32_8]HBD96450.1 chemotaxis protein CheW [Spirochaetia bacterium]
MEIRKRKLLIGQRFLSFVIENEVYCMEILKVKELLGMTTITQIPQTPEYIKGVLNLRGQIIPIIDLRLKFGMPFKEYTKRTSIIVTEIEYEGDISYMGIVVDSIQEVISIPEENISKATFINAKIKSDFIKGIANTSEGIVIVLDVVKILNEEEFELLKSVEKAV